MKNARPRADRAEQDLPSWQMGGADDEPATKKKDLRIA